MPKSGAETFTDRFNRLTGSLGETDLALLLGLSISAVRKLRTGDTQTLKLDGALRLCERLQVDPWELAFGRPRTARSTDPPFSMLLPPPGEDQPDLEGAMGAVIAGQQGILDGLASLVGVLSLDQKIEPQTRKRLQQLQAALPRAENR